MTKQVIVKFVKGFITGGLSAIVASLGVGISIHSLDDLKGVLIILGTAFISGGIHAIVEILNPTLPANAVSLNAPTQ